MSVMVRRGLLAAFTMLMLAVGAMAQQPPAIGKQQSFPTPDAAADALNDAARRGDSKALEAILGAPWDALTPLQSDGFKRDLAAYFSQWDKQHKVTLDSASNGAKATVEVGTTGWTLPMPIVKDGVAWRFDSIAGFNEMIARELGRNEFGAIQTLLAIGDAERDYAVLDPTKSGGTAYARRLLSSAGKKDGLYWPTTPGEPKSPLGAQVAHSQPDGKFPGDHYGYNFRLLYAQGAAAPGGARDYIIRGRMIGGFGAIAWPLRYGETGIMTFIMGPDGIVYQRDLGPNTAQFAASIVAFNPEKGWERADLTPP
ncbi:DUF2950 family protein [Reyranella soli]|uniref:DUF2950 domain-containing protein n=1 Tax=Reyranella soli TaxID=1230389 RepID=A0A512NNK0_9HYPH|nr:DUF2950 family protein [Reyranella soli]GEP60520.1 hypothetical protein RSO01_76860 [Reyranella soli]